MPRQASAALVRILCSIVCLWGGSALAFNAPSNASFNLANYTGKVVYVDFWASWCGPCRESFPFMADMSRQFGDELVVVAISVDEDKDDALNFLDVFEVPFEIVFDPNGELAQGFDVPGMPTSYLFDRDGNLLMRHIGFNRSDMEALKQVLQAAVDAR